MMDARWQKPSKQDQKSIDAIKAIVILTISMWDYFRDLNVWNLKMSDLNVQRFE